MTPAHPKVTCSPPHPSTAGSTTSVLEILLDPATLKAAETLAAEAGRVIGPAIRAMDALGAKCMGALEALRADIVDQATRPVPGPTMRRLHTAGALRGLSRRPRPRYADDGPR